MFSKILHANDGRNTRFMHSRWRSRSRSRTIRSCTWFRSKRSTTCRNSSKRLVRRPERPRGAFTSVLQRARAMAEESHVKLHTHVIAGHPVRDIVELADELKVDLLVIGATGHSAMYERLIGSRADRIMQLAHCPVLVVK